MPREDTQFKKGDPRASECGKMSKRGPSLTKALAELLEDKQSGIDIKVIAKAVTRAILKGNSGITQQFWDRFDGKLGDELKLTGEITNKIIIQGEEPQVDPGSDGTEGDRDSDNSPEQAPPDMELET